MKCDKNGGPAVRTCRECGCTDNSACMTAEGPCRWIEADLCSACDPKLPAKHMTSAALRTAVMAALPVRPPGLRPAETWRKIGGWSAISVRHALRTLVADGLVGFHGEDGNRRYWRGAGGMPPATVRHEIVGVRPLARGEAVRRESTIAGFIGQDEAIAEALAIDMTDWHDIFVRPVERPASAMAGALREAAE